MELGQSEVAAFRHGTFLKHSITCIFLIVLILSVIFQNTYRRLTLFVRDSHQISLVTLSKFKGIKFDFT